MNKSTLTVSGDVTGCFFNKQKSICRKQSVHDLTKAATRARISKPILDENNPMASFMYWSPTVDNSVLREQPNQELLAGNFDTSMPLIVGTVSHEVELFMKMILRRPMEKRLFYEAFVRVSVSLPFVLKLVSFRFPTNKCHAEFYNTIHPRAQILAQLDNVFRTFANHSTVANRNK